MEEKKDFFRLKEDFYPSSGHTSPSSFVSSAFG